MGAQNCELANNIGMLHRQPQTGYTAIAVAENIGCSDVNASEQRGGVIAYLLIAEGRVAVRRMTVPCCSMLMTHRDFVSSGRIRVQTATLPNAP